MMVAAQSAPQSKPYPQLVVESTPSNGVVLDTMRASGTGMNSPGRGQPPAPTAGSSATPLQPTSAQGNSSDSSAAPPTDPTPGDDSTAPGDSPGGTASNSAANYHSSGTSATPAVAANGATDSSYQASYYTIYPAAVGAQKYLPNGFAADQTDLRSLGIMSAPARTLSNPAEITGMQPRDLADFIAGRSVESPGTGDSVVEPAGVIRVPRPTGGESAWFVLPFLLSVASTDVSAAILDLPVVPMQISAPTEVLRAVPRVGGLLAGAAPIDVSVLQRAADAFFARMERLAKDLPKPISVGVASHWIAAAASMTAVFEFARRRTASSTSRTGDGSDDRL